MSKLAINRQLEEIKVLSTTAFGYRISDISLDEGFKMDPHILVAQGTSSDGGPNEYLGTGVAKPAAKKMFEKLLIPSKEKNIPFILSVGEVGTDMQLGRMLNIIDEIATERGIKFRIAVISGEISKDYLRRKLANGEKMRRLLNFPRLSENLTLDDVNNSEIIVGQMGPEPIMKALDLDVDGILTGRALDTALHRAMPLKMGFDTALAAHMAKCLECGGMGIGSAPGECLLGILRKDHFLIRPTNPQLKATVTSIAAHSFYERPNPFREENPDGYLDLSEAKYEQYDERTVKVSGSRWVPTKYTVKLEGVAKTGYRSIALAGIRDPIMIKYIDEIEGKVKERTINMFAHIPQSDYKFMIRMFGRNGVLGELEPENDVVPRARELCLLIDVMAKTQELAHAICHVARVEFNTCEFPERKTTAGNMAVTFSPDTFDLGEQYFFNIWHLIGLEDACEPFKTRIIDFPRSQGE